MSSDNPPKPIIDWAAIRHNAFTDNPGSDWIALDANLMPIGRASDLGAVMQGCPGAHAYVQDPGAPLVETIMSAVIPPAQLEAALAAEDAADAESNASEAPVSGAAAFDHDGDGKVGGSRSRNRARKAAQGE